MLIAGGADFFQHQLVHFAGEIVVGLRPHAAANLVRQRRAFMHIQQGKATDDRVAVAKPRSRFRFQPASVCPGNPAIRSKLMFSNPASLSRSKVEGMSAAVCVRPSCFNSRSSKVCAPKLARLIPRRRNFAQRFCIRQFVRLCRPPYCRVHFHRHFRAPITSKRSWTAFRIRSICAGVSNEGVPPPK